VRTVAEIGWGQIIGLALGSSLIVKVLDIFYSEIRRRTERSQTATRFVDEHLDPFLKSVDELAGKLHALARDDFKPLRGIPTAATPVDSNELGGTMYLFARFWAHIEILKLEGLSVAISQDERGKRLQSFLDCLESRQVRLIDRTSQRAIGETSLADTGTKKRSISFIVFVAQATNDPTIARWLEPLRLILARGWHTANRQKLLQYEAVLHALIDTLDPKHLVTGSRPGIAKKLSLRSWRDLNYRVFGMYLKFVRDRQKYLGPSRTRGPNRIGKTALHGFSSHK
jgi:hypothetical protein